MKHRGAWLAAAASLAALLACGSGNDGNNNSGNGSGSSSGGFPYTGPSCSSSTINEGCWGCLQSNCNGGCLTSDCNDFFTCFCNCAQGDSSCYQTCTSSINSSCQQCVLSISSCEMSSCSSACGSASSSGVGPPGNGSGGSGSSSGGGMSQTCGSGSEICADGTSIQFCAADFNGMCTSAYYQVGNQTFPCASCSDTTSCAQEAQNACGPTIIDAGPPDLGPPDSGPPDDVGPVPDAPFFDAGATCSSRPCGTMGQVMTYCETDDGPNGACTQAWYEVGAQTFYCASCSQAGCMTAAQQASMACP